MYQSYFCVYCSECIFSVETYIQNPGRSIYKAIGFPPPPSDSWSHMRTLKLVLHATPIFINEIQQCELLY
jgi:hypothetical protein